MEPAPPSQTTKLTIDFTGWSPLPLHVDGALRDAPREVAQAVFDTLMQARQARCAALQQLAARHDVAIATIATDAGARSLGAWLLPRLPSTLTPTDARGYGLAADIALWLGEGLIAAAPQLHWTLLTSHKKSTGYQRAVLTGFGRVDDRHYYVDVAHFVAAWVDYATRQRAARADFLATIFATTLADA
jgi:hypothetical protein